MSLKKVIICIIYLLSRAQIFKTLIELKAEKVSVTGFFMVRKSLFPIKLLLVLPAAGTKQIPLLCALFNPVCNPSVLHEDDPRLLHPALQPTRLTYVGSTVGSLTFCCKFRSRETRVGCWRMRRERGRSTHLPTCLLAEWGTLTALRERPKLLLCGPLHLVTFLGFCSASLAFRHEKLMDPSL